MFLEIICRNPPTALERDKQVVGENRECDAPEYSMVNKGNRQLRLTNCLYGKSANFKLQIAYLAGRNSKRAEKSSLLS